MILQSALDGKGTLTLRATAEGLTPAEVAINVEAVAAIPAVPVVPRIAIPAAEVVAAGAAAGGGGTPGRLPAQAPPRYLPACAGG